MEGLITIPKADTIHFENAISLYNEIATDPSVNIVKVVGTLDKSGNTYRIKCKYFSDLFWIGTFYKMLLTK